MALEFFRYSKFCHNFDEDLRKIGKSCDLQKKAKVKREFKEGSKEVPLRKKVS